jgi:hypothetical protein
VTALEELADGARVFVRWASAESLPTADALRAQLIRIGKLAEEAQEEDAPAELQATLVRISGLAPLLAIDVEITGGDGHIRGLEALGEALGEAAWSVGQAPSEA